MGTNYTNVKRKGKKNKTLKKLLKPALGLVIIGLTCATVYTLIPSFEPTDDTPAPDTRNPYGSLDELTRIETFMDAYLAVNGNETLLNNTQTLRISGEIETTQGRLTFQMFKKRPDLMRITFDEGSREVTVGVNKNEVWKRVSMPSEKSLISEITGARVESCRAEARFFDTIVSTQLGKGRILEIDAVQWSGRDCLRVKVENEAGQSVVVRVDPETMYPLTEEQRMADGTLRELVMADYRIVEGMPVPFLLESWLDGTLDVRTSRESVSMNLGLLTELFERPNNNF